MGCIKLTKLTTKEKLKLFKQLQNQWEDQDIVIGACDDYNNYENMNDLIDHIRGHIARLDAEGEKGIAHEIDDFCKGEIDFISDEIGTFTKEMEAEQTSISTKIEQAKEQLIQSCGSIRSLSEFNLEVTRYMTGKDDQQGNYAEQQEKVHRKKQEKTQNHSSSTERTNGEPVG